MTQVTVAAALAVMLLAVACDGGEVYESDHAAQRVRDRRTLVGLVADAGGGGRAQPREQTSRCHPAGRCTRAPDCPAGVRRR
jgi:hypothetical protein